MFKCSSFKFLGVKNPAWRFPEHTVLQLEFVLKLSKVCTGEEGHKTM